MIGVLINVSLGGLVAFCVASELAAIPLILLVRARPRAASQPAIRPRSGYCSGYSTPSTTNSPS